MRLWSRETGSAVPCRVSLLMLHTRAEYCAYSRDSSRFPRRRPFTLYRHTTPSGQSRVIGSSRKYCVPTAFTADSPRQHWANSIVLYCTVLLYFTILYSSQGSPVTTGGAFEGRHEPINKIRASLFPTLTVSVIGMRWLWHVFFVSFFFNSHL